MRVYTVPLIGAEWPVTHKSLIVHIPAKLGVSISEHNEQWLSGISFEGEYDF